MVLKQLRCSRGIIINNYYNSRRGELHAIVYYGHHGPVVFMHGSYIILDRTCNKYSDLIG